MAWKRFVAGFDPHGDMQDPLANEKFFSFIKDYKPHIRVAGGDVFDFRPIRKGADAYERKESMINDVIAGKEWLEKLKPHYFLKGNHDLRLWKLAEEGEGVEADYARLATADIERLLKKTHTRVLPYHSTLGILKLGHLKIVHGYHTGRMACTTAAQMYGSVLMGHGHAIQSATIPGIDHRVGRMCGCLCKLDLGYNSIKPGTSTWAHGFAYGVIDDRTGDYEVMQAESINGRWVVAKEFKEI